MNEFLKWLKRQEKRNDPIGDLARDARQLPPPESVKTTSQFVEWVRWQAGSIHVAQVARDAVKEWKAQR